ncbi:MAG: hypothetical protein JOZ83_01820 [Silvibacterium sp.]|nr:hypothetical protein [Silvibacterium sp.]
MNDRMIELRKLAALEVLFLGPKLVIAEYACGVFLSVGLGALVLARGHSLWTILGTYLICIGFNYLPLLIHAIVLRDKQDAQNEIGGELADKRKTFSKYRSQSLLLLVPLFVAVLGILQWKRATS